MGGKWKRFLGGLGGEKGLRYSIKRPTEQGCLTTIMLNNNNIENTNGTNVKRKKWEIRKISWRCLWRKKVPDTLLKGPLV